MDPIERLQKRLDREKAARQQAEKLLEEKSTELFQAKSSAEQAASVAKTAASSLMAILDNMPEGVAVTDPSGRIERLNNTAQTMFGTNGSDLLHKPVAMLLPWLEPLEKKEDALGLIHNPEAELAGRRLDGSEFPVEIALAKAPMGRSYRLTWMIRDITERKKAAAAKNQLEDELRQAQKLESLGTMAGGIAHELNTPIQFITDNVKFLSESVEDLMTAVSSLKEKVGSEDAKKIDDEYDLEFLSEETPQAVQQSLDGLKRVAEIVLAIKRFSHPTGAGKEDNDINEIVNTVSMVSKNEWKYVAELALDLSENLPSVRCNAGEIHQVLLNLIVNSAHAIEDKTGGGEQGKITVKTWAEDAFLGCSVSDTGSGIPPDLIEKVCDPFFTTKDPGKGTGQGLSIVHTIITQSHAGKLDIQSHVGAGTEITFRLPLTVEA